MFYCPNCGKKNRINYRYCYKCGVKFNSNTKDTNKVKEDDKTREFKVNKYIMLKLEKGKTIIYVNNDKFSQCKYLLIEIPSDKIEDFMDIESIDDASEHLDHSLEQSDTESIIPPDVEFWGHCSNLQAWAEYDYDTRLLHSNLAFPLLKRLTDVGDPKAKQVFKDEIAKRIESGKNNVVTYLINENYLEYFDDDEFKLLSEIISKRMVESLFQGFKDKILPSELSVLMDFVKQNILHSKNLKLMHIKELNNMEKETQLSIELNNGHIVALNLINCDLVLIPESIKNLKELTILNLMWNKIEMLPAEITSLNKLKIFILSSNKIKTLPSSIKNWSSLETLKLDHNQLLELPSEIGFLFSLKILHLWNNRLKTVPNEIGELENLRVLGLSHNYLKTIPASIGKMYSLETLDLSNNLLEELPHDLSSLLNLKVLWVNNNKLERIPYSMTSLPRLNQLYLFANPLIIKPNPDLESILDTLIKNGVNIRIPKYMI